VFFNFIFVKDGTHNSLFFTILYAILVHCTVEKGFFYKNFGDIFPVTYSHFGEVFKVNTLCSTEGIFPTKWPAPYETQSGPDSQYAM